MTPERHQQVKRLFLAAAELPQGDSDAFLQIACAADDELRCEVQSLLDHHRTDTLLQAARATETPSFADPAILSTQAAAETQADDVSEPLLGAGMVIAGRYQLVELLGRGGMGVVYRAKDQELNQTVALKFLNPELSGNPQTAEFLRREVSIARKVTHPNVVRVFDIGAGDGQTFISMEFVAGEDLGSLVRRVGPLTPQKSLQVARQSIDALAAAHEAGVLHRDLKPANVMIDGAGNVRILDFGIAALANEVRAEYPLAGTPGFIAPELLTGKPPSPQSDLYAWALVVYYAATGEQPAQGQAECNFNAEDRLKTAGYSDEFAATVRICLSPDPAHRLCTARQVLAVLSGGDPLEVALREGRMPPGDLLAAASSWQPTARILDALLGAGIVLLVLILLFADQTLFLTRCGLVKSPEALREIAEQLLVRLGYSADEKPVLRGVALDTDCLQFVRAHSEAPNIWGRVSAGEIPAVTFWYRQGDSRLPRAAALGESHPELNLPSAARGTLVRLDGRGKLLSLEIRENSSITGDEPRPAEWDKLFDMAGLSRLDFQEIQPTHVPPLFANDVRCWEGPFSTGGDERVQVTAASNDSQIVYFLVDPPWAIHGRGKLAREANRQSSIFLAARTLLWLVSIGIAAWLAWRHMQQGHADWRGACRVAAAALTLATLHWLCNSQHSFVLTEEIVAAFDWLSVIVLCGAVAGTAYLAVEPLARRWWPWSIVTVPRLLAGQLRDRRIWSDVLLGLVVGLGSVLLRQLGTLMNQALGIAVSGLNDFDPGQNLLDHFGFRTNVAVLITALLMAALDSLLMLALIVGAKRIVKSTPLAAVIVVLFMAAVSILGRGLHSPIDWLARVALLSIGAGLILRFGLLPGATALATYYAVNNSPITLNWSVWYTPVGLSVVAIFALALWASWRMARPPVRVSPLLAP